jgi:hypothetical protein
MSSVPEIYSRPWFRCLASIGFRLHWHLNEIYAETDDRGGRSWRNVVRQIEKRYELAIESPSHADPDYMTKFAQEEFLRFAEGIPDREGALLGQVLIKVAAEMTPLTNEEMDRAFEDLSLKARELAQDCATEWGGPEATLRASKMKPARLNLDANRASGAQSALITWTDGTTIHIPTGAGPRPVLDFLCLKFYLFHEYLSHHLPYWEDGPGVLSEGYLFPVERWWYTFQSEYAVSSSIVDTNWDDHWGRLVDPQGADYWRDFHDRVNWIESQCPKPRLSWIFLEMACFEGSPRGQFQEAFLGFFDILAKREDLRPRIFKILRDDSSDIHTIYKDIQGLLRSTLSSKARKALGLDK